MPAEGSIDLSTCLINQKLHMVVIFIPYRSLVELVLLSFLLLLLLFLVGLTVNFCLAFLLVPSTFCISLLVLLPSCMILGFSQTHVVSFEFHWSKFLKQIEIFLFVINFSCLFLDLSNWTYFCALKFLSLYLVRISFGGVCHSKTNIYFLAFLCSLQYALR